MEKHVQIFLNKISFLAITIATLALLTFLLQTPPETCIDRNHNPHPKSSCDAAHRPVTTVEKRNRRLWSTNAWRKAVDSFSALFRDLQTLNHLTNHSHVLVLSASGGQAVMSLNEVGLSEVTGVELVDSPPLVSKADPHNLPFSDRVFDLGFSANLDQALFPSRYVRELERTVRDRGRCVVCVEECGTEELKGIMKLFRKSEFSSARNITLMGSKMTMIITRRVKSRS